MWEVPGGKLDEGQDLLHAQEREVLEETGLLVRPTIRLVYADSTILTKGKYVGMPYVCLFSVTEVEGGILSLSEEHDDYVWALYDQMFSYDLTHETRKAAIVLERYLK